MMVVLLVFSYAYALKFPVNHMEDFEKLTLLPKLIKILTQTKVWGRDPCLW